MKKGIQNSVFKPINLERKKEISRKIISVLEEPQLQVYCRKLGISGENFPDIKNDIITLTKYIIEMDNKFRAKGHLSERYYNGLKVYKLDKLCKIFKISDELTDDEIIEQVENILDGLDPDKHDNREDSNKIEYPDTDQ
jgi:hypothetical protein